MAGFRTHLVTLSVLGTLLGLSLPAAARASVTISDNYFGGQNTYNGADIIGETNVFDIQDAVVQRIGVGGNTIQFTIDTNYAGAPGTGAALGTGYGSLFITPGLNAWHPTGPAPYVNDVYQPGEWAYALTMPQNPGAATSGASGLFSVSTDGVVVMSNVGGNPVTYPHPGNPGYYFREGQAVQFTPFANVPAIQIGSWTVALNKIVFTIQDNHLLGDNMAISWAMTCANDVIQGQVSGVPEPGTWVVMFVGFGLLGAMLRRSRAQVRLAAANL